MTGNSLTPDEVGSLIKRIIRHIKEKSREIGRHAVKFLKGMVSNLERLLNIARRKLKKRPALAKTYRVLLHPHHAHRLAELNLIRQSG